MKKILLVSYHFPPDAAVGGIRTAKFSKYLPEFGWSPIVLTAKEKAYDSTDQSRMSDVVDVDKVFRTVAWPDPSAVYMKIKKWWYSIRGKEHIFEEKVKTYSQTDHGGAKGRLGRMRYIFLSIIALADGKLGWIPPAMLRALFIMTRHRVNCVFTSGPPHTAHLVGLALKMVHRTRWIADFRDPMTLNPIRAASSCTRLLEKVEQWMEKRIVTHADKIVSVTGRMSQAFMEHYPEIEKSKFVTISNGFDPADLSGLSRPASNCKFRMSYIGTFYLGRTPSYFLKAVRELVSERNISRQDIEICFIGSSGYIDGRSAEDIVQDEGLSSMTKIRGPLPYKHAIAEMAASHVLLLLAPNQYYQIPGKAFEYMASGADIIALTSDGATADLLRETGCGIVAEPNSIHQIKAAIEVYYQKYKVGKCRPKRYSSSQQSLNRYHRKTLTKELVSVLQ